MAQDSASQADIGGVLQQHDLQRPCLDASIGRQVYKPQACAKFNGGDTALVEPGVRIPCARHIPEEKGEL